MQNNMNNINLIRSGDNTIRSFYTYLFVLFTIFSINISY